MTLSTFSATTDLSNNASKCLDAVENFISNLEDLSGTDDSDVDDDDAVFATGAIGSGGSKWTEESLPEFGGATGILEMRVLMRSTVRRANGC